MDHLKGALGPLASMVMEFHNLLCKNPSKTPRELIPAYLESWVKKNGSVERFIEIFKEVEQKEQVQLNNERPFYMKSLLWESFLKKTGSEGFIEMYNQYELNSQMELNKELESPELKGDLVSLYNKLVSLIREGEYREKLHTSEEVKVWAEARELSYDLEDVVEKFLVYLQEPRRLGRLPEIDTLKKLMKKMANVQLPEMINHVTTRPASTMTIDPRIQGYTEIPGHVDTSRNMETLKQMIYEKISSNDPGPVPDDSQYEPMVVCVVGLGGLGKTSLVRKLYDEIKKDFSCTAFVTVGRNRDVKKVLVKILLGLDNENNEERLHARDEWQLTDELNEVLCKGSYLIVIDDIWNENLWEFIKCAFYNKSHSNSRVLTTTRSMSVAEDCCRCSDGRLIYQMPPLSDEDSKTLFYSRVFTQERGQCHDDFKQVSEAILKKCGGVPLAINTMGSLLGSNGEGIKPISEWNHLLKSIGSGLTEGDSVVVMNKILSLSYDDLPPELKNCLLYMVVFPEDYVIKKDHLVSKWIAEDFVRRTNKKHSLFDVAESYFNMLIQRSMIEPVNIDGEGKAKACRIHDIVLGFLCSLSIEANFVTIIDGSIRTTSNSETKIRRLSIQNTMATAQAFIPEHSDDMEHVRSFTLSSSNHVFDRTAETFYKLLCESENGHTEGMEPLKIFEVLRVLDLRDCCAWLAYHQTGPLQTDGLVHLRYLGLKNTIFSILPEDLGNIKFLQILDIRNYNYIEELPSSIVKLRELIYLRVDPKTRLPNDFGTLTSLEKLTHVLVNQDSSHLAKQLGHLTKLRVLRITPEDMNENLAKEFVNSLNQLLEIRTIEFRDRSNGKIWRSPTLQSSQTTVPSSSGPGDCVRCMEESWKPSSRLQKFWADNDYCFLKLPKWITQSCNISSLSICLKEVGRKDIEMLGRLQYLRYLNLTKEDRDNIYPANPEECFKIENKGSQSEHEDSQSENKGFRFDSKGFLFANDAFRVARELRIAGIVTLPSMFKKGAMPKVQILEFHVRLEDFNKMQLDMQAHLPSLKQMKVIIWYEIDVQKVTNGAQGKLSENYSMLRDYLHEVIGVKVKDAEAALRAVADSHPNRPTTDIATRRYEHGGDLEKNKFELLMHFLKTAEEAATEKRISFSDAEAVDVMQILVQRIPELSEPGRFPSVPTVENVVQLLNEIDEERSRPPSLPPGMSPKASFREMMLASRGTRNKGIAFAAKSDMHTSRPPSRVTEFGESSGLSSQPLLHPDDVKAESIWSMPIFQAAAAAMLLSSNYTERVNVQSTNRPLRLTEIDEADGLPSLPLTDRAPTTRRDAREVASGLPFAPPMDSDESLLLRLRNMYEEQIEHRAVEESMLTKLAEDRARDEVKTWLTCKGKEKIIYTSSDQDITCSRQPLRLTEFGEGSGFRSMQSLDPDEDKFKNDEDGATAKLHYSSDVDEVDVKTMRQPLRLTKIGEASGFPSMSSLEPDADELKLALLLSMEDVTLVIDADVTKGEYTSKVNEAEITKPVAQELATTIAEITILGTGAAATTAYAAAEEDPSKRKSTAPISVKDITSLAQLDSSREVVAYGQNIQGRLRMPYSGAESLDELELNLLSVMSSVRLAKETVKYELDLSRQEGKDLALKNTTLHMALAAEKTQVEELKMRLAVTENLMKGLVETNKELMTKLEEARTEVDYSAAQFKKKYKHLEERIDIKDIRKSKYIDCLNKEHEDLQTKHNETINSFNNLQGEMNEKLQDANQIIVEIDARANEAMLSQQSLAAAATLTLKKCWSAEAMSNSAVTLENQLEQLGDFVNDLRSSGNLVCKNVWPTEEVPLSGLELLDRLRMAPTVIDEWKVSAARASRIAETTEIYEDIA